MKFFKSNFLFHLKIPMIETRGDFHERETQKLSRLTFITARTNFLLKANVRRPRSGDPRVLLFRVNGYCTVLLKGKKTQDNYFLLSWLRSLSMRGGKKKKEGGGKKVDGTRGQRREDKSEEKRNS